MADIGIDDDFVALMAEQTPENTALAGRLDAANGVALPGSDGHVIVGGNWEFSDVRGRRLRENRTLPTHP
jgi:spermidine dehydrogenase